MKRPPHLALFILFGACLIWFIASRSQQAPVAIPDAGPLGVEAVPQPKSEAAQAKEQAAYEQQTRDWVGKMEKLEAQKQLRARAEARTEETRGWLQRDKRDAWTALLATNREAFAALREKARHSPDQQTACTICDGRGSLAFCILCNHGDGKCVTCLGTGRLSVQELCPTCMGSGKCYLCRGSGKMTCPFCNDGLIWPDGPQPPLIMPLR